MLLVTLLGFPTLYGVDAATRTKELVAVLKSDAPFFDKARACQQLGEIGTAEAVPALAGLLADAKLSAYARSGLEGIPDPSAVAALREAAQKLEGPLLAGIVNSLGVLRDEKSAQLLADLASDPSSRVTKEALLALGNIATPEAIRTLETALTRGRIASRPDAAAACLLAADRKRTGGDLNGAKALYDLIRGARVPVAYRAGATRGAILTRGKDRVPFLIEQLRAHEEAIRDVALVTIREVPDDALADALNQEVTSAAPALQGRLLMALIDCHDKSSIPVIQSLCGSAEPKLRTTAMMVLGRLGPDAAPALLALLEKDQTPDEKPILLNGLKSMEGSGADDLLLGAITSVSAPAVKIDLIRLLDSRGVIKAAPAVLKLANGPEGAVRTAALSAMRSLAGIQELPSLINLAQSPADPAEADVVEAALAGVCARLGDAASQALLDELMQAKKPAERSCWIRVLGGVGYSNALPVIQSAITDSDSSVAESALDQLGHWPNPAPMAALLTTVDAGATPALREHALGAVLDLATTATDEHQAPDSEIVEWLRRINPLADSVPQKRRILSLLGRLSTTESLRLLIPYLDNPDLRTEAAAGIVQITPALSKSDSAEIMKPALEKIAMTVANADLKARAGRLAKTVVSTPQERLFDGHSLAGWEGDTSVWRAQDGLIVGGSLAGNPRNEFLATTRGYTNFILRLEYKLVGTEGFVNSGVQFRSVRMTNPPNEMNGYQADVGAGYSGCLYDESRRNTFLAKASPDAVQRLERTNDWNRYEIRCDGPHIMLFLNGEKTVDYSEPDGSIPQRGLIGLQIHGGNKAEVSFRNIIIQEQ
ncbi:MAG: family 16 glycoside hydrolase [Limisphaerales bacterium]